MQNQAPKKLTKKVAREQIGQALSSLAELENTLGKKKFQRRIAKAEKILAQGLPKEKKVKKIRAQEAA